MNISIHGSGYVGLVTGACLADVGYSVLCTDIDQTRLEQLQAGHCPIFETGLEAMLRRNLAEGRLRFSSDMAEAVRHGRFQFIAVGTAANQDGSANIDAVLTVARSIGTYLADGQMIVNKSTAPPGTTDRIRAVVAAVLEQREQKCSFDVVSNPEFLREGDAVRDFMAPDRIIIGADTASSAAAVQTLYAPFHSDQTQILLMDCRSAELTKYAANAMLATRISFMNEMANLAERVGADIEQVRLGIGSDRRIGTAYLHPGPGYGGSCFPKDLQALGHIATNCGYQPRLLSAVEAVNQHQKQRLLQKITAHFNGKLNGKTLAVWGLSFKPDTDDMREAPSRPLLEGLWAAGARVQAYDPAAHRETRRLYGERDDLRLCTSPEAALVDADALIIVTEWGVFRNPDFDRIKTALKQPVIFDGRNLYNPARMRQAGFIYYGFGRGEPLTART